MSINLGGDYFDPAFLSDVGFGSLGDRVLIHSTCVVVGAERISIGSDVRIDPYCCLIAGSGSVQIGRNVHIGAYSYLSGAGGITIGDFANISQGVRLYTRSDDYSGQYMTNPTVPSEYTGVEEGPVVVADHCIIGSGSIVLPNVRLGTGAAIGALSLVKSSLEEWGVYAGVPAQRLSERRRRPLELAVELSGRA